MPVVALSAIQPSVTVVFSHPPEEDVAGKNSQGHVGRPRLVLSHAKVLALSQEGATIREIAEEMGASPASIHRILKGHHRLTGDAIPV
jgi:Homeodomain-like domain